MKFRLLVPCAILCLLASAHYWPAEAAAPVNPLEADFNNRVKPFLQKNCAGCHNADNQIAGVRVDNLDAGVEDKHVRIWEAALHRVSEGSMPPKGMPQPSAADRKAVTEWMAKAVDMARLRPAPKNGLVRRLTVAQYRNTLRDLLQLDDDLTELLPPEAISKDGFVNNKETLQISPLQIETYFEIAEEALNRAIVDPRSKPKVQNFRMDLGAGINKAPLAGELILGANSMLLDNKDFTVTQLTAKKPFAIEPYMMQTKFRYIEGYQGNDTVRGWRDFDSIYHAVFACLRGSRGYPKGQAYSLAPEGLLLRPAIPNDEIFTADGTYGPKANFKISLRELPDTGRFRVTVNAAKYNDGLLLDAEAPNAPASGQAIVAAKPKDAAVVVQVPQAGVYQVDVHPAPPVETKPVVDGSQLSKALGAHWSFDGETPGLKLIGDAKFVDSPFGKALSLDGMGDEAILPRSEAMNFHIGDFSMGAWIRPGALRRYVLLEAGGNDYVHGWSLELTERGALRIETVGPDNQPNGTVTSQAGLIRPNTWTHVAVVVRRLKGEAQLFINGYPVTKGAMGSPALDNLKRDLHIGRLKDAPDYRGQIDEIRLYKRALEEPEVQALVEPGRQFAKAPPERPIELSLSLGERRFSGTLHQPAFLVARLDAGALAVRAEHAGTRGIDRVVLTPVAAAADLTKRFLAFEKRTPKLGVYLGFRRDCGSTLAPVGGPQTVAGTKVTPYVFEGAIGNYPNPNVEKDNVNYLAGVREIAVHSLYTDGRDMPRMAVKSVEFEGPFYDQWPPVSHKGIFVESAAKTNQAAYAREILTKFATRAYRRPATAAEVNDLVAVYQKAAASGREFHAAVKDALQVVLTSPQFLYLVETSASPAPEPLTQYELASKLSYFLWNGPPDKATLALAANGTLRAKLGTEVDRLIASPKFAQFTREFAAQWLALDKFQVLEADKTLYPKLTRDMRMHLMQEPIEFVHYLIQNNLPVKNLIQSDFAMMNEAVAAYYDMGDRVETGWNFVPVTHGRREMGGVLTQPAILAGLSNGRESNPIKRGAWLARRIIAEPPADPPPNVPAVKEDGGGTLRERLEQHRNQSGCRQCHTKIDPWGIPFEEFDAGGRKKTAATDASSTLPDKTELKGFEDLRRYLAEDRIDQVAFSALKHLATYGTGRTLTYNELGVLKQDGLKLKANGYRMKDMVRYVAGSRIFLEK